MGEAVLLAGVPSLSFPRARIKTISGLVTSNEVAEQVLQNKVYDETHRIIQPVPFDAAKEIMVLSSSIEKGFSGGALFNESGSLAGLITQLGTTDEGLHFYRILKSSYIASRIKAVEFPSKIRPIIKTLLEPTSTNAFCVELLPAA